jgi:hypothetical protein
MNGASTYDSRWLLMCLAIRLGARVALQQSPILRADPIILNQCQVLHQYELQAVLPMSPVSSVTYVPDHTTQTHFGTNSNL